MYSIIWHIPLFLCGQCDKICVFYHFRLRPYANIKMHVAVLRLIIGHIAHLRQECHNSKSVIFPVKLLMVLKCYNFLWVQRRHNCSQAASFTNRVMTLYLLKVHLQTFLSIWIAQKCQIVSCDTLVTNERYVDTAFFTQEWHITHKFTSWSLVHRIYIYIYIYDQRTSARQLGLPDTKLRFKAQW